MVAYKDNGLRKWFVENATVAAEYARSKNGRQREAAARSHLAIAADLGKLMRDSVPYVRQGASENPKTPAQDLIAYVSAILSGQVAGALTEAAASNPALPAWFVEEQVVRAVKERKRGGKALSLSVERLIAHPNLPERVMLWLVEGKRPGYTHVLENPTVTGRVLRVLASDRDWGTRCDVACHNNTPVDVLEKLAHDRESIVRETAFSNRNMPASVFDEVIVRDVREADVVYDAVHPNETLRVCLLVVSRLAPPYADESEERAFRGMYEMAEKWLDERGITVG